MSSKVRRRGEWARWFVIADAVVGSLLWLALAVIVVLLLAAIR